MKTDDPDVSGIRALLCETVEAWKAGDADAYAASFTEDCRYIAYFGSIYRGRHEIAESHRVLFTKALKDTQLFVEIVDLRFIGDNSAMLVTRGDSAKKRPRHLKKVQSYLAVRVDGVWRFAHFQNTKRHAFMQFLTYRMAPEAVPSLDR